MRHEKKSFGTKSALLRSTKLLVRREKGIQRCLIWLFHMLLDGSTIDRISELSYILPTRFTTDDFHKLKVSLGNLLNLEGDRLGMRTYF